MARPPRFDDKMSDAEGLMWRLESDPYLSSTFANVTVLDRPVDLQRLRRRMELAVARVPRLRQRVQPPPVGPGAPTWVDDPEFDLDYHVRRLALPKPATMRQLCDLAALIAADPFDRTRPLWQFAVVDGLRGGRGAMIQKLHHTLADGESSLRLSMQYLDVERDAPEPEPVPTEPVAEPQPPASPLNPWWTAVEASLRLPLGLARQTRELMLDPTQIPVASAHLAGTVRSVASQLADVESAHSPLWTQRSLRRRIETLSAPLEDMHAAAKRLGGTLNSAFICAAATGAGAYHRKLGAPVEELRATMAISTRTAESGANAFALARMLVPTGEMPIAERFLLIHEATAAARDASASARLDTLAAVAAALPTSLVTRLARQQAHTVDFATSNVRGADFPCYVGGAQVLANYPVGPLAGVPFNLTLLSYCGSLDMGLNVDVAAVAEPSLLKSCIEDAFAELSAAD